MVIFLIPMGMLYLLLFLFVIIDFICFLAGTSLKLARQHLVRYVIVGFTNFSIFALDLDESHDCCGNSWTWFAPAHRLSVYVLLALAMAAYLYCIHREKLAPPVVEVALNCLLLVGIALYGFIAVQINMGPMWFICPLPAALLFIIQLAQNHRLATEELSRWRELDALPLSEGPVVQFCWFLLSQKAWTKLPVLLLLCLPLLVCVVAVLMLFGQKPDSLVQAFTQTYKQGFSQLDLHCNQMVCGGHFLCTIAAKGHKGLVKPLRAGVRAGAPIKCNRQLLISNAFEEWLEQNAGWLHGPVRRLYNHVGSYLHRHYGAFDRKWVSDTVYLLMKPLEWLFLLVLYVVDRHPENRIAQQYMSREDRQSIKEQL